MEEEEKKSKYIYIYGIGVISLGCLVEGINGGGKGTSVMLLTTTKRIFATILHEVNKFFK